MVISQQKKGLAEQRAKIEAAEKKNFEALQLVEELKKSTQGFKDDLLKSQNDVK